MCDMTLAEALLAILVIAAAAYVVGTGGDE